MPESHVSNIEPILKEVKSIAKPDLKILDVGIGHGNFGELLKNRIQKKIHLTGVEIFEKYKNPKWDFYDKIILGDILNIIDKIKNFDVILAIDIIEHFKRQIGIELIKKLRTKTKILLVSVPVINYPQDKKYGNIHERHLTNWRINEMLNLGAELIYFNDIIGVFKFK